MAGNTRQGGERLNQQKGLIFYKAGGRTLASVL